MSSSDSTRKTPRWPPESAGLSTAGKPTSSAARRRSESERTAAKRGCGTPASASRARIATLCVIRCAVCVPIPGSPRASATAATIGTARSALTVRTPSSLMPRGRLQHGVDVREVDDLRDVGLLQPGRVRVPVDRRDPQSQLLRLQDRPALVAPGADEEDGSHGAMLLGRQRCADELDRPVDVDREAGAEVHGQSVEHDAEELADLLERQIVAVDAVALALLEMLGDLDVQLGVACAQRSAAAVSVRSMRMISK